MSEDTERRLQRRGERIRHVLARYIDSEDYFNILRLMGKMEETRRVAQFKVGEMIAGKLETAEGRATILDAASAALEKTGDSIYLLHLVTLCQAMDGDYRQAGKVLTARINRASTAEGQLPRRSFIALRDSWRVVDLIAREKMDWVDDKGSYGGLIEKPGDSEVNGLPQENSGEGSDSPLGFKEHALQGRLREEYLQACEIDFGNARTLAAKFKAIGQMLRTGIRHIPEYKSSYRLAKEKMLELGAELDQLIARPPPKYRNLTQHVLDVSTAVNLTHRLGLSDQKKRCVAHLLQLSRVESFGHKLWSAPAELSKYPEDEAVANLIADRIMQHIPKIDRDMRHFFQWALNTGNYKKANEIVRHLHKGLLRKEAMEYYVGILQRQGRFEDAIQYCRKIHGQLLSHPHFANAYANHRIIKRIGELQFLVKTAKIYGAVKQPSDPVGIVLIAPRNIDHLRRYPLMVLLEMKRRGWAVIPIVEGLLPRELTGIADIDVMNGAIRPNIRMTKRSEGKIGSVREFECDPRNRILRWGKLDLHHSMWEDAAINRRRYSIDYECPELQRYLGGLGEWTKAVARVLGYAHSFHRRAGYRTACMSLFNCRLPDSVFRLYCQEYGDEDDFFCLHAANGYQNYFTNFSTNLSRRFVVRNVTKASEVRSGSFPIPENFERYYDDLRHQAPAILQKFEYITKVKRSTAGNKARPAEAMEAAEKIKAWRRAGGKVACAFGKVVCDSNVPFDGGPAHHSMKDWINHSVRSVRNSNTLLLVKPHPHELNNQIATFPTEYFVDLVEEPLGDNAMILGHRWFDIHDMKELIDIGLIYNGTTTVELGLMGIPCLLAGHFAPIDYPVGHAVPENRAAFEAFVRFEKKLDVASDLKERCAVWLDYMSNEDFTLPYRYHARPVTNKVLYPPWWIDEDLVSHKNGGDPAILELTGRALGERPEPGAMRPENALQKGGRFVKFFRQLGSPVE